MSLSSLCADALERGGGDRSACAELPPAVRRENLLVRLLWPVISHARLVFRLLKYLELSRIAEQLQEAVEELKSPSRSE